MSCDGCKYEKVWSTAEICNDCDGDTHDKYVCSWKTALSYIWPFYYLVRLWHYTQIYLGIDKGQYFK